MRRFYLSALNLNITSLGDGKDWFGLAPNIAYMDGTASKVGFDRFSDNTVTRPPAAGDILGYDGSVGGGSGHVAIIKRVRPGYILTAQQNWDNESSDLDRRLTLTSAGNHYNVTGTGIQGWLRPRCDARQSNSLWHPDGTLLVEQNGTVWFIEYDPIDRRQERRVIPDEWTFVTRGWSWCSLIKTTTEELNAYPIGAQVGNGERIIRRPDGAIFRVNDRGYKQGFNSMRIFDGLGYSMSEVEQANSYQEVDQIPDDPASPHLSAPFPDGTLVRNGSDTTDQTVYVITEGGRRAFSSSDAFGRLGYDYNRVLSIDSGTFNQMDVKQPPIDSCDVTQACGGSIDEFGPNVSITSHTNGQTVTTSSVTISGTASDLGHGESGIASVTVNGVRANGDTASGSYTANWSRDITLNPGANTITVAATDNAPTPNQTSQTITLTLSGGNGGGAGVIATGLSNPTDIATDGVDVFWTDWGTNSLKKVSVNGGSVTTLFSGAYNTSGIALDNNYAYFGYGGELRKIPKNGGSIVILASNNYAVSHLAVDSANVYWTNYSEGTIKKVSINGGTVTTLANGSTSPSGITRAGNNVYWTEQNNPGAIKYVSTNGGSVVTLANNSNTPGIASDGTNIYWTENVFINSGKVSKVPLLGGATTAIASSLDRPSDVEVDSANAYWIGGDQNGYVAQVPLAGGSVTTLANGLSSPVAIAADSSNVYWIERNDGGNGSGTLKKAAKGSTVSGGGIPLNFTWQYKQSMPQGRYGAAVAVYNNQIYVIGGDYRPSHYRYDPSANSWVSLTNVPGNGIFEGGAATVGSKIYAIGNIFEMAMKIYDISSNSWTSGAVMPGPITRGPAVAAVNGKVFVIGGADNSLNGIGSVQMYDPTTNIWSARSSMPTPRAFPSVAVVNNLIYVIGGLDSSNSPNIKRSVEVYNPASDTWSTKNPAPVGSYIAGYAAMNNRIYILGGGDGSNPLNTVNEYDPATDSWRMLSPLQAARYQLVGAAVNNKLYAVGGSGPNGTASTEEGTATGYAPSLSVTPRSQTIYVGSFATIWLTLSSAPGTDTQVMMSSSNSSIASVSNTFFSAGSTTTSNTVWGNSAGGPVTIHVNLPDSLAGISDDVTVTVVNRPPDVTTTAAGTVTSTSAILGGYINPQGTVTNAWFEYGTDITLSSYYSSPPQLLGAGNSGLSIYENLNSLSPNTVYYFRAVASSNAGTSKGSILSFPTSQLVAPSVTTQPATGIATTAAVLNASVNPNGLATTAWFEWGTDPTLSSNTATGLQSMGSGNSAQAILANLAGLASNTTYYFRATGSNSSGTTRGTILSFSTPSAPTSMSNLALNKPATQSSDLGVGGAASKGVDGNTDGNWANGSVTHTDLNSQAWWQVDLGAPQSVQSIEVWNRTDCCGHRLSNFKVLLLDSNQALVGNASVVGQGGSPTTISLSGMARYVKVQLVGSDYLSLAEVKVWGTPPLFTNLALNKPATQSSDLGGGPASKGVDGNTDGNWANGSVTHTNLDSQAWWQVDMGATQSVQSVEVWNRTDCCGHRLSNFKVLLLDSNQALVSSVSIVGQGGIPTTVSLSGMARYVKVQLAGSDYLSLAEVKVWGTSALTNLALNKPATQSSDPGFGAPASKGVDGNTSGNWANGSVTHTNLDNQAWWQVDMGQIQSVGTINLWNRTDCCADRLSNFYVFVSDVPFVSTDLVTTQNQSGVTSYFTSSQGAYPTQVAANRTARYVRVQLVGSNYLSLAEVQVLSQ